MPRLTKYLSKIVSFNAIHGFSVLLRTGSNPADINRFRSYTGYILQEALNSLLENLRFGKSQSIYLKEAVRMYVTEQNINKYVDLIDTRIAAREDYLYACSLVQVC